MQTNNRRYLAATVASAALTFSGGVAVADTTTVAYGQQAHVIIQQFATTLKGELQQAMKSGGPANAVGVCKEQAPAIAASLAEQTGWEVGRTSLKPRNAALNTPDAWEQRVLKQFEDRKAAGQPVAGMTYAEVVQSDSGRPIAICRRSRPQRSALRATAVTSNRVWPNRSIRLILTIRRAATLSAIFAVPSRSLSRSSRGPSNVPRLGRGTIADRGGRAAP